MTIPKPIKKIYIAISNYGSESGKGSTLEAALEDLKDLTKDVQSPDDCEFYDATPLIVKTKIYIIEGN